IYDTLKQMGRNPAYLSLNLDDVTRKAELERFEKGDSEELINVDICTEGYDYPELKNIVEFDTNGTHGQWVQKVGRVLRTAPKKTSCTVLDFGGNIELYPDGVETDVNLDGVVKKPKGECLRETDFFRVISDKDTNQHLIPDIEQHTPYNPPKGFETVLDADVGIVFVACTLEKDCVIFAIDDEFIAYTGNKSNFLAFRRGDFSDCIDYGLSWLGNISEVKEREISKMQIQLLAPEYATSAMDWYGANCCICWKTWKEELLCMSKNAE
ncbi:MAG TPA: helicase-related protein, partial [Clostridia bacterium]|nr:helicase-related protein [Clostridia bacterium]